MQAEYFMQSKVLKEMMWSYSEEKCNTYIEVMNEEQKPEGFEKLKSSFWLYEEKGCLWWHVNEA